MKIKNVLTLLLITALFIGISNCSKKETDVNGKLDNLEKIIVKYEPLFKKTAYATPEYTEMIKKWNEEIAEWAKDYENGRYETDSAGNMIVDAEGEFLRYRQKKEYLEADPRLMALNNRMTSMILKEIPEIEQEATEKDPATEQKTAE